MAVAGDLVLQGVLRLPAHDSVVMAVETVDKAVRVIAACRRGVRFGTRCAAGN